MNKSTLIIRTLFYGVLLSTLIGLLSFAFIYLESNLSHHIWEVILSNRPGKILLILMFCLVGGLLVGSLRAKWGDYPQTAHHSLTELKEKQTVDYRPTFKSLLVALIILIFGAGVGPEAALLGAIIMLSVWQADKLRYLFFQQDDFMTLTPVQRVRHMLHPTRYLTSYSESEQSKKFRPYKKYLNTFFVINGLLAFVVLMKLTKQPSFITKMGPTHWSLTDFWLLIPLIILGLMFGKGYTHFQQKMTTWFTFWMEQPIKKALLGSLAIFSIALFMPNLLFSGQVTLGIVPTAYTQFSVLILFAVVIIKLVFLQVCLQTGWVGGDIFPIVFSAILLGFATSQLIPNGDTTFIVATVATAMVITILNSPIVIALFIALFFPIQILPIILLVTLLLVGLAKLKKKRPI